MSENFTCGVQIIDLHAISLEWNLIPTANTIEIHLYYY